MPTYSYVPSPPPLTQEELDRLAAEQVAMGGTVPAGGYRSAATVPEPPATTGVDYAAEPIGGNDTIATGYTAPYGGGSVGQQQGYGISDPSAAVPAPPSVPAASEFYGGPDPNTPALTGGIVSTSYPATGRPSRVDVMGPTWKRQQRIGEGIDAWFAHPTEHAPASAYDPLDPTLGGTPHRRPTAQVVEPVPLPVSGTNVWAMDPSIEDVSTWPEPSWRDVLASVLGRAGVGLGRSPLANELGMPLRGGPPPRSG